MLCFSPFFVLYFFAVNKMEPHIVYFLRKLFRNPSSSYDEKVNFFFSPTCSCPLPSFVYFFFITLFLAFCTVVTCFVHCTISLLSNKIVISELSIRTGNLLITPADDVDGRISKSSKEHFDRSIHLTDTIIFK